MQLTNRFDLPEPFVRAVAEDSYSKGAADFSITELIGPPRLAQLLARHDADLSEDVDDRLYALFGQAVHHVLEQAGQTLTDHVVEERLFADLVVEGQTYRLSGKVDLLALGPSGRLSDYKITSVWAAKHGLKDTWITQLNAYVWLARANGYAVTAAEIVTLYRDWRSGEAKRAGEAYPPKVQRFPVDLWPTLLTEATLADRLRRHVAARIELPPCTPEERWVRPTQWAVTKQGRKSALRVLDSEDKALAWCVENGHATIRTVEAATGGPEHSPELRRGIAIEERVGAPVRCADGWCPVASVCDQFQAEIVQTLTDPVAT